MFKRESFSRPLARAFFETVKSNHYKEMMDLLLKDKYLIYTFDLVCLSTFVCLTTAWLIRVGTLGFSGLANEVSRKSRGG